MIYENILIGKVSGYALHFITLCRTGVSQIVFGLVEKIVVFVSTLRIFPSSRLELKTPFLLCIPWLRG
jgi:hypothetical protein